MNYYRIFIALTFLVVSNVAFGQLGLPAHSYQQTTFKQPYEFNIVLQNDSTFKTRSRVLFDQSGRAYISVTVNGVKHTIYPSDTKSMAGKIADDKWLAGMPADSCWLFKTDVGKINSYSCIPDPGTTLVVAIQKGEGAPLLAFKKENLLSIVGDNPKATKLAQQNKLAPSINQYNHPPVDLNFPTKKQVGDE